MSVQPIEMSDSNVDIKEMEINEISKLPGSMPIRLYKFMYY
jgi:hypothetical protein